MKKSRKPSTTRKPPVPSDDHGEQAGRVPGWNMFVKENY